MDATIPPARTFLSVLTGSFSSPAADNPTVAMMESAYRQHGLDARYVNCEVPPELLRDAVRGAWAMGWVGFNCSMPHKVTVIAYLDQLAESAAIVGAVNCVVRRGNQLVGENTDGQGFLSSLRTVINPAGKAIVLFGAGGAARAIAVETALAGAASITVVNRDRARGGELVELINGNTSAAASFVAWDEPYTVPEDADIVVNATPIGMFPQVDGRLNIHLDSLLPGMVVADVIPNPPWTRFLRSARERGCTTIDGLGMLVNQGAINVRHWTGVDPDPAVMRHTLEELFQTST
jgi:shikimate dehydrogenase